MTLVTPSFSSFWARTWKPSHRSLAEQGVGLGVFVFIAFAWHACNSYFVRNQPLDLLFFPMNYPFSWLFFYVSQSLGIWCLWRRFSLCILKLECSLFVSQLILCTLWSLSFYFWQETLLSLVVLLLQIIATLLNTVLFWKKERFASLWMLLGLIWGIYVGGLNMIICLLE